MAIPFLSDANFLRLHKLTFHSTGEITTTGASGTNFDISAIGSNTDLRFLADNDDGSSSVYFLLDASMADYATPDYYTRFPDNSHLVFGNSANTTALDFEIYHEGTTAYLQGDSSIYIASEDLIQLNAPSGVELRHNSSRKLYTGTTGINVTGTVSTSSDGTSANWKQAYDNYITGVAVTGTSTKTITLTQRDGGTITTTFTDLEGSGGGIDMTNGSNDRVVTAVDSDTVNGEAGLLFGGSYLEITPGNIATPLQVKRTSASTRQVNLLLSANDGSTTSEGFLGIDSGADLRYGGSSNTSANSLVLTEDNTDFVVNSSTNNAIIRLAGGGTNFTNFNIGGEGGAVTISSGSNSVTVGLEEFIEEKYIYTSNDSNAVYMPMVKGGMYATTSSSITGQILIKIPAYKAAMMQQFYVDIYDYSTGESMTFKISGYSYDDTNATWYNTSVVNLSDDTDRDFTVRFGADTTNSFQYVAIGETNSTWNYPQINVRDFYGGYATSESDAKGSFNVSFVTTTPGSVSRTHTGNFVAGDYNNLKNTPTIPTVNNGTLTVQGTGALGGSGTFTANQSGNTTISISHDDTSSQASVDNSGNTVIQDVTLDGYGHVTGLASKTLSIPTVNNATLTVQGTGALGGSGTFTANQSTNATISISHDDTSSQSSVDNSNGTVIQDVTLDGYGHVTALGSVNLDGRYYTETESDNRFVNETGDTMTGQLNMHAGAYEGSITFGSNSTWRCGIRQHDDADAELRIWAKNTNGMIFLATGYDGEAASISRPTDGLVVVSNNVGIGNFSSGDPSYKLHTKGDIYANGGWLRVSGDQGLYFQSYGGGWYMTDSTWIRSYNNKSIYHNSGTLRTDGTFQVGSSGSTFQAVNGGAVTINGNTVWHAGNDGAGTGLDADLLDSLHASSFLRSDANDTWSGDISTTSTNGIRFGSSNQTDGNDGYIAAGRFASGLNIVGTQTTSGTGRQIRLWGNLITNDGHAYWHANNDGAGSGLDADLLDGQHGSYYLDYNNFTNTPASGISQSDADTRYVNVTGDTMTGDLKIQKSTPVFELNSNMTYPYGRIEFAGTNSQPYEIVGQSNPGTSGLALRVQPGSTMQDAFVVKSVSLSAYNYSAVPLRIGADSSSNELDDYEEGTYNISFSVGSTSYTATSSNFGSNVLNSCKYVKVGRMVTVFLKFQFQAHPSAWTNSGTLLYMNNLPFTPLNGTLSGGCMFNWIEHSVTPYPSSTTLYRFPDDYGHVQLRQGYSSSLVYFYKPSVSTGYYNYYGESSMVAGDWPGSNPGGYNYLTGSFTYYTTS